MGNCCSTETVDAAATVTATAHAANAHKVVQGVALQHADPTGASDTTSNNSAPVAQTNGNGKLDGGGARSSADLKQHEPETSSSDNTSPSAQVPRVHTSPRKADLRGVPLSPDAPGDTYTVQIGDYNLRYSYYSKRGYYPEARKKANQDSYYCETHFAGDDQKAYFAVFDGHGQYGDMCSQFAAQHLPEFIADQLEDNVGIIPTLTRAHVQTNRAMHDASFDDSMSGTTSISVLFSGNDVHIANVGDSRAIIAQENLKTTTLNQEANLVAKPLSIDQTPFRKDERERVKKCGARILTVDQVEGLEPIHENWGLSLGDEIDENGDPPRIWHPYGQYPGTAFTRSIGDLVSEELGVIAEPEILCKTLNPHDKFIVVASDGVFEFLTSQNVVDIVKKFDDPAEACQALVEDAYSRWLQFEVRTDDITAIVIYLDGLTGGRDGPRGSIYAGGEVLDLQSMQRPVRGTVRKEYAHRPTIVGTDAIRFSLTENLYNPDERPSFIDDNENPLKADDEIEWIKDIVQSSFLFNQLSDEKIMEVISILKKVEVNAGDVVIRQGAPGDTFYLVDTGEFEVRQLSEDADSQPEIKEPADQYGDVLHVYKSSNNFHPTFGELALIYSKPRAATVIATQKGSLWALDRIAFRSILMRGRPMRDIVRRLRQISLLRPLTVAQTNLVAEEMKTITFDVDQVIYHEGMTEPGFFVITSGKVESTSKNHTPLYLKPLDYFGEVSLVRRRSVSQATLRALEPTECLFIKKDAFELAVGKLSSLLEKDKIRKSRNDRISGARNSATKSSFVMFDSDEESVGLPKTVDELDIVGSVFSDPTNTVRLAVVKGSSPRKYMTLRSVSKQAIFDGSMQAHICGERDIYMALYEKNTLVPHVCGMNTNDTDIHLLYDTQIVGNLESFLDGEPHGESFVRYYASQVVMALEFIHSEGIVSRTVDPTQLMIDRNGNIRMLNLRLSKYVGRGRTYTVCGTPEYLSPEQIKGEGHNIAADYWALGVLMYELLCGYTPFSKERTTDLDVLNHIASFDPEQMEWPEHTSIELQDLIKKLLCPDLSKRLGVRDAKTNFAQNACAGIKKHSFFAGTSWEATKIGSFAAPLEAAAVTLFKEIAASRTRQELNIGSKYTGDEDWLAGF